MSRHVNEHTHLVALMIRHVTEHTHLMALMIRHVAERADHDHGAVLAEDGGLDVVGCGGAGVEGATHAPHKVAVLLLTSHRDVLELQVRLSGINYISSMAFVQYI
jgi:hypothetical protein